MTACQLAMAEAKPEPSGSQAAPKREKKQPHAQLHQLA